MLLADEAAVATVGPSEAMSLGHLNGDELVLLCVHGVDAAWGELTSRIDCAVWRDTTAANSYELAAAHEAPEVDQDRAQLEDTALVARCVAGDSGAWRAFMERFDVTLRRNATRAIGFAWNVLPSDAIDDVMGAFYLRMLENNMRTLANWHQGGCKGRLAALLTFICNGIAVDHARAARRARHWERRAHEENGRGKSDTDPNRGATWLAIQDRNTRDRIKRTRNRKDADE